MKEGLFGGTFNPLHNGHLQVIAHVKARFDIDRIHLIPSSSPPHKSSRNLAPAGDRLEMIRQAVKPIPGLVASDLEVKRKGPSFSIDTIKQFIRQADASTCLYFILGADAFFDMDTWKKPREIFKIIPLIVMTRAGEKKDPDVFSSFLSRQLGMSCIFNPETRTFHHPDIQPVHLCQTPEIAISSTTIRKYIKQKRPITALVPGPVKKLIDQKGLYL